MVPAAHALHARRVALICQHDSFGFRIRRCRQEHSPCIDRFDYRRSRGRHPDGLAKQRAGKKYLVRSGGGEFKRMSALPRHLREYSGRRPAFRSRFGKPNSAARTSIYMPRIALAIPASARTIVCWPTCSDWTISRIWGWTTSTANLPGCPPHPPTSMPIVAPISICWKHGVSTAGTRRCRSASFRDTRHIPADRGSP